MATVAESPIGQLILAAEKQAKKKSSGSHSVKADCGCEVKVSWFTEHSRTVAIERCYQHPATSRRRR